MWEQSFMSAQPSPIPKPLRLQTMDDLYNEDAAINTLMAVLVSVQSADRGSAAAATPGVSHAPTLLCVFVCVCFFSFCACAIVATLLFFRSCAVVVRFI